MKEYLGKNFRIVHKEKLSDVNYLFDLEAPDIAAKYEPGQFVILRMHERGERIPLTIADADVKKGIIQLIFQVVGKSTSELSTFDEGDTILDLVGPLGNPIEVKKYNGKVVCVGGGVGIAPIYPKAKALFQKGNYIISILGARTKSLLILEDKMRTFSNELYITTDDGSTGRKGVVTEVLREVIEKNRGEIAEVVAIGPTVMMKFVCQLTKEYDLPTLVSLNPIMVDGSGMCGGCRATVKGETKFSCVNGPCFDGHLVDWDELSMRLATYTEEERVSAERYCKLKEQLEET